MGNSLGRPWRMAIANILWSLALRRNDAIIAISETVRRSAIRDLRLKDNTISVIHRSVGEAPQAIVSRVDHPPMMLTVGRLVPQKGHELLLRALATSPLRQMNWSMIIAGEGWLRRDLESLVLELDLGPRIRLVGQIDEVPRLMAQATLFVFPSLYEGLGVSLIEAAAHGLPCVVADIPPLREIVPGPQYGFPFTAGDASALAGALAEALSNPSAANERGERLKVRTMRNFSRERMLSKTVSLYNQVARCPISPQGMPREQGQQRG